MGDKKVNVGIFYGNFSEQMTACGSVFLSPIMEKSMQLSCVI